MVNKIEDLYNRHAVKIISSGIEGSGCLIQPADSDYTFVFTAKHCLTEVEVCKPEDIQILRFNDRESQITIQEIYLHPKYDIAILKVGRISPLPSTIIRSFRKGDSVTIYGYPKLLRRAREQRQNIKCEISFNRETYFELVSENIQFTFDKSTPDTIKGFSGSGVFFEDGERLFIGGILTKLKAEDGAYSSLCASNISLFDELIATSGLPSLDSDNFHDINKDYELLNSVFSISYTPQSAKYYQERNIDSLFINYLKSPKNIWISGISGVGKTLLVLRNLNKENKSPKHIDLTCSQINTIDEYFEYINNELVRQLNLNDPSSKKNIFDQISDNLCSINGQLSEIVIFVDEVPISDKDKFYDFLSGFINISERYSNLIKTENKIKWIVSTRIDPEVHLRTEESCHPNKLKAKKNFRFRNFKIWDDKELTELLNLLQTTLNFSLSVKTQTEIKLVSKGLPGILKSTIERVLIEDCTMQEAIRMIQSENY